MNEIYKSSFDQYGRLLYRIFFDLISIGIVIIFLIYLFKFLREDEDELYPKNLKSDYYVNKEYNCNLEQINNKNPIQFCGPLNGDTLGTKPIGSWFSTYFIDYATNIGHLNGGSISIFWFWIFYLLFETEVLLNMWLNMLHSAVKLIIKPLPIKIAFIFIFVSLVTNVRENYVAPLLGGKTKNTIKNQNVNYDLTSFFINLPKIIFMSFLSIFMIVFAFLLIPALLGFLFTIVKSLTKNLSWEVNLLSFFTLYLCAKTFQTFILAFYGFISNYNIE